MGKHGINSEIWLLSNHFSEILIILCLYLVKIWSISKLIWEFEGISITCEKAEIYIYNRWGAEV
ncbi:MAG: hypothetical protein EBW38_15550, partial [Rhodobacteraceae bacterium]|nr:hypothetical protein [Paracoccaceae bacterium]